MPTRPLRIIHAANFGLRPKGVFLHGVGRKLSNGWVLNGHHVIDLAVGDMARWMSPFGVSRALGMKSVNRMFRDYCVAARPDVLALGHAEAISAETVAAVREALPELRVLQWNVDWLLPPGYSHIEASGEHNLARILAKAPVVDATFVSTAGPALEHLAEQIEGLTGFLPNPVDPALERAHMFARGDAEFDLVFTGGSRDPSRIVCGEVRDMGVVLDELARAVPRARINAVGVNGRAPVFGPAYQAALESATIGLNVSRHNDVHLYSSDRIAHIAGNGLAVLIERATGYAELFDEDDFAFYGSLEELAEQLARLVGDDAHRRRVAENGWRRYGELFGHTVVARYMIDALFGEHDAARYEWPTLVQPQTSAAVARAA